MNHKSLRHKASGLFLSHDVTVVTFLVTGVYGGQTPKFEIMTLVRKIEDMTSGKEYLIADEHRVETVESA